jgi:hypothetical protein
MWPPPLFGWSASDVVAALNYILKIKEAYAPGPRGAQGSVTNLYSRVGEFENQLELLKKYLESQNTRYLALNLSKDVDVISPTLNDSIMVTLAACMEYFKNPIADFTNPERQTLGFRQLRAAFRHVHGGHAWAVELGNRLNAHELQIHTFMLISRA